MQSDRIHSVIATARSGDALRDTLASLAECNLPRGYQSTIVVENGSKGGAEQVSRSASEHLRVVYLFYPNANKSEALNHALRDLEDSLIFFTDDDIRFDRDVLVQHARNAASHGRKHFFGGACVARLPQPPESWLEPWLPGSIRGWSPPDGYLSLEQNVLGCNWSAFANEIRAAGGFDRNFGPGAWTGSTGQESNMQRRLRSLGAKGVGVPSAIVYHHVEHFSEEWLIHRAGRLGIEYGLYVPKRRRARATASWFARKCLPLVGRSCYAFLRGDSERKFLARYRSENARGFLRGVWLPIDNRE